jgi:hypothetical protein
VCGFLNAITKSYFVDIVADCDVVRVEDTDIVSDCDVTDIVADCDVVGESDIVENINGVVDCDAVEITMETKTERDTKTQVQIYKKQKCKRIYSVNIDKCFNNRK